MRLGEICQLQVRVPDDGVERSVPKAIEMPRHGVSHAASHNPIGKLGHQLPATHLHPHKILWTPCRVKTELSFTVSSQGKAQEGFLITTYEVRLHTSLHVTRDIYGVYTKKPVQFYMPVIISSSQEKVESILPLLSNLNPSTLSPLHELRSIGDAVNSIHELYWPTSAISSTCNQPTFSISLASRKIWKMQPS